MERVRNEKGIGEGVDWEEVGGGGGGGAIRSWRDHMQFKPKLKFDDVICFGVLNNYSHLELFAVVFQFSLVAVGTIKCLVEVSIGRDRGQEPSNRECSDHISAVGTYML